MKTSSGVMEPFFHPRVNMEMYLKGFNGYRTMALGVYHVCEYTDCSFMNQCVLNSSKFDKSCPVYASMDQSYYSLSNSNQIEIDSFLENSAKYPTYNIITKFLLKTSHHVSDESKIELWNSIAFSNFIQNYHNNSETLDYSVKKDKEKLDANLCSFLYLLEKLSPEVLYVFDDAVADCIKNANIPEVEYHPVLSTWPLPVHKFTYNPASKDIPSKILSDILEISPDTKVPFIIDSINKLQNDSFKIEADIKLMDAIRPHIWDKRFVEYLLNILVEQELGTEKFGQLRTLLLHLSEQRYTLSPESLVFDSSLNLLQYERDFILFYIINCLKIGKNNIGKQTNKRIDISEVNFLKYLKVDCRDEESWRNRKKEVTRHISQEDFNHIQTIYNSINRGFKHVETIHACLKLINDI